jgi:drug/metabolite transporter (DMT)-like permease
MPRLRNDRTVNQSTKAALWMTGAIVSFTLMAVGGRELGGIYDTFEIMFFRSVIGFAIVCAVLSARGLWHDINTRQLGTHVTRNVAHFIGQNLWFLALTLIPLAQVFALEFTTPLWVILFAALFLGEGLTRMRIVAVLLGFCGVLVVAQPSAATLNFGVAAAAGCAVFFAITAILTKRLTASQSIGCIMFWLTLIQIILGLVMSGYDGDIRAPELAYAPWLIVIALGGLMAHFSITNALAIAPAALVAPFDFARLPTIAIVGVVLYEEPLGIWVILGALIIFLGVYLNILAENRKNRVA